MAQEAFAKMDQHLDPFTRNEKLMSWSMKDLTANYSDILDQLTVGSSKILDGVQWSRRSTHLNREDLICVPKDYEETMLEWAHKTDGNPGWRELFGSSRSISSLRVAMHLSRRFYLRSSLSLPALRLKLTLQRIVVR